MARYGKKAQQAVADSMEKMKQGKLKSGGTGKKVRNPKQAIAIGLSEARRKGARVPPSTTSRRKSSSTPRAGKAKSARP